MQVYGHCMPNQTFLLFKTCNWTDIKKTKQFLCSHDATSMEYLLQICLQTYFSQSDTYNMVSLCVQMLSVFLQDKGINACDHCIKIMLFD